MEIIDNINKLLGDDLKSTITSDSKLKIAASCFSIYAYEALKKEYNSSSKGNMWVLMVTGYDPYDLKPSGKVLTYVLADILNLHESYFDDTIPDKGLLEISEWNDILDEVYKKNKLYLGLYKAV